jgi:CHASE3 domain sensor protein
MKRFVGCTVLLLMSLASLAQAQEMPAAYKQVLVRWERRGISKTTC